ncbi:SpoIID/LytB domain-containing protein [bacterium]|nr:SpoIID/LytB domain-containing protein [bacterium]
MKKIFVLVIFLYFILVNCQSVFADSDIKSVRVAISDTNFVTYRYETIEFNNASDLEVLDTQSGQIYSGKDNDEILRFKIKNNNFELSTENSSMVFPLSDRITIRSKSGQLIEIKDLKRNGKQARYRGIFELVKTQDMPKFYCINILGLEAYLRAVVPNEMPVRFGLEALKAQSVAARNYTIASKYKTQDEYDVSDSVASQVYFGAATEKELSDKAITETMGIIALSKEDEPILALYSSTAGGHSENYENAFSDNLTKIFPSEPKDYLLGKPDTEGLKLTTEEEIKDFYSSYPETFDNDSPYFRWTREWTEEEFEEVLKKTVKDLSTTGFVTPRLYDSEDFGHLKDIEVVQRGVSGKVMFIKIMTDKNVYMVSKELMIRRCFKNKGKALPSANFFIEKTDDGHNIVYKFIGGGFGHGVGMSQWGAGKMASKGYRYDEILNHYYSNIRLTTCPEIMRANGEVKTQIFYSELPKAWVYIEHNDLTEIFYLTVNGETLEIDLNKTPKKVKVDISAYLKKGINEVKYFAKEDTTKFNDYIKIFTEIKGSEDV